MVSHEAPWKNGVSPESRKRAKGIYWAVSSGDGMIEGAVTGMSEFELSGSLIGKFFAQSFSQPR